MLRGALLALICMPALAAAEPATQPIESVDARSVPPATPRLEAVSDRPTIPDLGAVRYRDPEARRQLWLGAEVGGVSLPSSLGVFSRDVWTARVTGAWALALSPRIAAGGRHALVFYDATNVRLQVQEHSLDLSARLLPDQNPHGPRDRLALTAEFHTLDRNWVDGSEFSIGGVGDSVAGLGYGLTHPLTRTLELAWNFQARWVWVFDDTQRQLRASLRPTLMLGAGHRLAVELLAFLVHRDASQFGNPLPRTTLHSQLALQYDYMSRDGVGSFSELRYASGFMSGQAPMYEIREEAINTDYAELHTGVRIVW